MASRFRGILVALSAGVLLLFASGAAGVRHCTASDFQNVDRSARPGFQFSFSLDAMQDGPWSSSYFPSSSYSSYSRYRDHSLFHDLITSYFGLTGAMFSASPSQSHTMAYTRRSGEGLNIEKYSGLSNAVEDENTLLAYYNTLRQPLSPVTIKTSVKSNNSTTQGDSAADLIRVDRFPFNKKDANVNAQWEFDAPFSVNFGYRYQRWERDPEYWENANIDEHSVRVGAKASPFSWLNLSTCYSQSLRMGSNYHFLEANPEQPEQLLLPKFSISDRNSARVDFTAEVIPARDLSLVLNCGLSNDTYDNSPLNMTDGTSWTTGAAMSWSPISRVSLNASYRHDSYSTRQSAGSAAATGTYRAGDTLDTLGVAVNVALIPEKLHFIARGSHSVSNSDCGLNAAMGNSGRLTRAESYFKYQVGGDLSLKLGYLHEDFAAGNNAILYQDSLSGQAHTSHSSHVVLGLINYDF